MQPAMPQAIALLWLTRQPNREHRAPSGRGLHSDRAAVAEHELAPSALSLIGASRLPFWTELLGRFDSA